MLEYKIDELTPYAADLQKCFDIRAAGGWRLVALNPIPGVNLYHVVWERTKPDAKSSDAKERPEREPSELGFGMDGRLCEFEEGRR